MPRRDSTFTVNEGPSRRLTRTVSVTDAFASGAMVEAALEDAERDRFLKDEYLKLQDQYEDYDRRSLTIKGWVSAGAAGAIALGAQKPDSSVILIVVALFALCFWYLEANWKIFQYAVRLRIKELEAHFRGEMVVARPLQMYAKWFENYVRINGVRQLLRAAVQGFVMLPYALIIAMCLAIYIRLFVA